MKRVVLCMSLLLWAGLVSAQRRWFLYLQSEQEQPFFVKMNDKVYSASSSGYLILSQLSDSSYTFGVGFPQARWPEQRFTVNIRQGDKGYLLKYLPEKGWGLFDLQTAELVMPSQNTTGGVKMEKVPVSSFTEVLSKASSDTTLKYRPVAEKPAPVKEPGKQEEPVAVKEPEVKEVPKPETPAAKDDEEKVKDAAVVKEMTEKPAEPKPAEASPKEEMKVVTEEKEVKKTEPEKTGIIQPEAEEPAEIKTDIQETGAVRFAGKEETKDGTVATYEELDESGEWVTVRILIPPAKQIFKAESAEPEKKEEQPVQVKTGVPKSNCKEVAGENDFLKLRRRMAAATSDDGMIAEARKYYKNKCFTTQQLRNLSSLFLSPAGKYNFFDASYGSVSDPAEFPSLESEIKDPYYVKRFQAMLR